MIRQCIPGSGPIDIGVFISIIFCLLTPSPTPAKRPVKPRLETSEQLGSKVMKGVVYSAWDGSYRDERRWRRDLEYFHSLGVNWIQLMTFAEQRKVNAPYVESNRRRPWPKEFISAARKKGFKIFLKPHVWSREFYDGSQRWRGSIKMEDDEAWSRWFKDYSTFIVMEAERAEKYGVDAFSIGLEYVESTRTQGHRWRVLIDRVRRVYSGLLTYSADGNHEAEHVDFWPLLDFIGINAYYELSTPILPGGFDLDVHWSGPLTRIQALQRRYGKQVVFTEVGYPSTDHATAQPWRWPKAGDPPNAARQAQAYESLFRVWSKQPFFGGLFWWKFYETPENSVPLDVDYTPRDKPAEAVLKRWYSTP